MDCLTIKSTDSAFMRRLIDWLNDEQTEKNSTTLMFYGDYDGEDPIRDRDAKIEKLMEFLSESFCECYDEYNQKRPQLCDRCRLLKELG